MSRIRHIASLKGKYYSVGTVSGHVINGIMTCCGFVMTHCNGTVKWDSALGLTHSRIPL